MDDESQDHIDPKGPKKRTRSKKRQTHNLPTDDVENINSTSKGRDLIFAEEQKECCKGSRGTAEFLYIHHRILYERKPNGKNLAMARIDYKNIWYSSAKLDNRLHQIISDKVINYENMESWIDSRWQKLSWNKYPKRYISRRCTITLTIHNCHDAN